LYIDDVREGLSGILIHICVDIKLSHQNVLRSSENTPILLTCMLYWEIES